MNFKLLYAIVFVALCGGNMGYAMDSNDEVDENIVELTDAEKDVREMSLSYLNRNRDMKALEADLLLMLGCGFTTFNRPDSYNKEQYPLCQDTLAFLVEAVRQNIEFANKQHEQGAELRNKLYAFYNQKVEQRFAAKK